MAKIEVASCTISELFSGKITANPNICGDLEIPEYQRPYVWEEKEIDKLLSDIWDSRETKDDEAPIYYIGSIILHKDEENKKLAIIDGQQRITTLAIIQYIKDGENEVPGIKYIAPATKVQIEKNHKYLTKKHNEKKFNTYISFDNLNVTLVVTCKEDDAYTFFETQNTGGVRLSGVDIIKAHHLRDITERRKNEQYAIMWENLKNIEYVVGLLIKARRWNVFNFVEVPSSRNIKETKVSIVEDFSEKTLGELEAAYSNIIITGDGDYSSMKIPPYKYSIRQPLKSGVNFIEYLNQFAKLYQRLFKNDSDVEIHDEYYTFRNIIISRGSAFLKEFYEIALLCYVNKFGTNNLLEASHWVFFVTFSLRFTKTRVMEKSIQKFIQSNNNYLFDNILSSFTHVELIESLKKFEYDKEHQLKPIQVIFITELKKYFVDVEYDHENFDSKKFGESLKKSIKAQIKRSAN